MSHPLDGFRFRFREFKGFSENPGAPFAFAPISVLVGRNNSGKSAIIDALEVVLTAGKSTREEYKRFGRPFSLEIDSTLTEPQLQSVFRNDTSMGGVPGSTHWAYGRNFVGQTLSRGFNPDWAPRWLAGPDLSAIDRSHLQRFQNALIKAAALPKGLLLRVAAERNVQPEADEEPTGVAPDGSGLSNLIRAFLHDSRYPMAEVEIGLRQDLNVIYRGDADFTRIISRRDPTGLWEIYLSESGNEPIRLSQSGSSLKSIFIVLATLRLNPLVNNKVSLNNNVLCIEEPENNLHPSLLRRLLEFLADRREQTNSTLLVTTHSSAAIDWATRRDDASTYHVRRVESGGSISEAREYLALRDLLQDLDIRASEILQANGVIWVEGPSDRLYVRRWLDLASEGTLREGVHYAIMFYGGKLLSHLSALPPEEAQQAISLLRLNRNLVTVIDSDRRWLKGGKFRADINETKRRIISESESIGGYVWVTEGKEIENYVSSRIMGALTAGAVSNVDKFEAVSDRLSSHVPDKISLAHEVSELTTDADLDVLDLRERLGDLLARVKVWNS